MTRSTNRPIASFRRGEIKRKQLVKDTDLYLYEVEVRR